MTGHVCFHILIVNSKFEIERSEVRKEGELKTKRMRAYKSLLISKKKKEKSEKLPSARDDWADGTSRYERYKKDNKKSKFPPIEYEKPPHH